ncbi:hypothetical protein NPIL_423871 [Nephila pilipes]|uniref:Uncharacterized protein n=1 Tax=Nephila pilipes TaxID=299642 RepID=A0A8X6P6G8_NEPPI|nr:hypothetical protein NPIL_423871 [Nephila pilipes]
MMQRRKRSQATNPAIPVVCQQPSDRKLLPAVYFFTNQSVVTVVAAAAFFGKQQKSRTVLLKHRLPSRNPYFVFSFSADSLSPAPPLFRF